MKYWLKVVQNIFGYDGWWSVPKLKHYLHSSFEKVSLKERTMQYIDDRTESFDDYFPYRVKDCKLKYISNWLNLFVDHHNNKLLVKSCVKDAIGSLVN